MPKTAVPGLARPVATEPVRAPTNTVTAPTAYGVVKVPLSVVPTMPMSVALRLAVLRDLGRVRAGPRVRVLAPLVPATRKARPPIPPKKVAMPARVGPITHARLLRAMDVGVQMPLLARPTLCMPLPRRSTVRWDPVVASSRPRLGVPILVVAPTRKARAPIPPQEVAVAPWVGPIMDTGLMGPMDTRLEMPLATFPTVPLSLPLRLAVRLRTRPRTRTRTLPLRPRTTRTLRPRWTRP